MTRSSWWNLVALSGSCWDLKLNLSKQNCCLYTMVLFQFQWPLVTLHGAGRTLLQWLTCLSLLSWTTALSYLWRPIISSECISPLAGWYALPGTYYIAAFGVSRYNSKTLILIYKVLYALGIFRTTFSNQDQIVRFVHCERLLVVVRYGLGQDDVSSQLWHQYFDTTSCWKLD